MAPRGLSVLFFCLLVSLLRAHDVDLPEWVRQGWVGTLDLYEDGGALRVELSFRELDLQALGGDVEGRIRARLSLDGRAPLDVKALPPSPRFAYRRWEARFAPPLPASFILRAPLFDQGGWIRIYDFLPGAVDPGERNWILEQGTAFRFPEARSPGRISVWGRFFRLVSTTFCPQAGITCFSCWDFVWGPAGWRAYWVCSRPSPLDIASAWLWWPAVAGV